MAAKAKALFLEIVANHPLKNDNTLLLEEKKWMGIDIFQDRIKNTTCPSKTLVWRLRETDSDFQDWWRKQGKTTIFFNGASKGNLGTTRAGRVIYSPKGTCEDSINWGLGKRTNN